MHYTLRRYGVIRKAIESRLACPRLGAGSKLIFLPHSALLRGATDVTTSDQGDPG